MEIPRFQKNKINIVFINVYLIISTMFRSIVNNFIQSIGLTFTVYNFSLTPIGLKFNVLQSVINELLSPTERSKLISTFPLV